jgi:L-ascorbate metabolism protein UlaG (beta-lactamase superfamily)
VGPKRVTKPGIDFDDLPPIEAVQIFRDIEASQALGIHWGTFQLTNESRQAPRLALAVSVSAAAIPSDRFLAAQPGGGYDFR